MDFSTLTPLSDLDRDFFRSLNEHLKKKRLLSDNDWTKVSFLIHQYSLVVGYEHGHWGHIEFTVYDHTGVGDKNPSPILKIIHENISIPKRNELTPTQVDWILYERFEKFVSCERNRELRRHYNFSEYQCFEDFHWLG